MSWCAHDWPSSESKQFVMIILQWVNDCPPREDELCGNLLCHLDGNHDDCAFNDFYYTDF
jgi:hypothetical protein